MLALCPLLGSAPSEVPTLGALQAARVLGFLAFTEARFGTLRPAQAAGSFYVKACFGSWLWEVSGSTAVHWRIFHFILRGPVLP